MGGLGSRGFVLCFFFLFRPNVTGIENVWFHFIAAGEMILGYVVPSAKGIVVNTTPRFMTVESCLCLCNLTQKPALGGDLLS